MEGLLLFPFTLQEFRALLHLPRDNAAYTGPFSMKNPRQDGLILLLLGIAVFILFGAVLKHNATDSMEGFRGVFLATRCLLEHGDPYNEKELLQTFRVTFGEQSADSNHRVKPLSMYIYLPPAFPFIAPFTMLPWGLATWLWLLLTAATLIAGALSMWDIGARASPVLTGCLISFVLANGAILLGNGNPAGVVIGLCASQ
jgi:hypothetical protein